MGGAAARRVLVATRSAGKVRELLPLLREFGVEGEDLASAGIPELPEEADIESGTTFEENALAKARYFARRTGRTVLAEDSGLCVDALGGAPGVYSKRWSGRGDLEGRALDAANIARLLEALHGESDRGAAFVCCAVWCGTEGEWVAHGETRGRILDRVHGAGGFGYDPVFFSEELGSSFGVVGAVEKARVSHRARAMRTLLKKVFAGS